MSSYTPTQYSQQSAAYGSQQNYYSQPQPGYDQQLIPSSQQQQRYSMSNPPSHYSSQMIPGGGNGGGLPPYGYPPASNNNLRRQNSQSAIYGSHFSLNSNYADPYMNAQQHPFNASTASIPQSQYYQQQMSGLGHGHGGSTFSLASQYTTASSAGVPPYNYHQHPQPPLAHHQQQQQVPMQNAHVQYQHHQPNPQQIHNVHPQLQRTLSQTQQTYAATHQQQPVSQTPQYTQQHHQQPLSKSNYSGGGGGYTPSQIDYPPEYGLPPLSSSSVNINSPPNQQHLQPSFHRHLSPQNSGASSNTNSLQRAPPPYRPPPPAANNFGPPVKSPPSHLSQQHHMRRSSLSSSSMSAGVASGPVRFNRSPSNPGTASNYGSTNNLLPDSYNNGSNAFQYQRSVSGCVSVFFRFFC